MIGASVTALLVDTEAERMLVAIAIHAGHAAQAEARACLELIPPESYELRRLLAGHRPALPAGLAEEAALVALYPCCADLADAHSPRVSDLFRRVWTARARRELQRFAVRGDDKRVRRAWAALIYMTALDDDPIAGARPLAPDPMDDHPLLVGASAAGGETLDGW